MVLNFHVNKPDAPGACIYCDATEGLTEEHIVTYAMWGSEVIPEACCPKCRDATTSFEQICAREMFGDVRAQWRMFSRKKEDRKRRFAEGLSNPVNFPFVKTPNQAKEFVPLFLPIFGPPGIIEERPKTSLVSVIGITGHVATIDGIAGLVQQAKAQVSAGAFMKLIAKTAYCAAVAEFGLDITPRDLISYIMGEDLCIPHLVGGAIVPFPDPPSEIIIDEKGKLTLERYRVASCIWENNGRKLLVYGVQFLRFLGTPTYWAVVGHFTDAITARVESEGLPQAS